jgi:plasmid stabilization system protein ParE
MPSNRDIRFTAEAQADLVSLLQWALQEWGEEEMRDYAHMLLNGLADLDLFADMRDQRDELAPGVWDCAFGQHVVFYDASDGKITACRVFHLRHDPLHNFGI